jgi:hypothetical protein
MKDFQGNEIGSIQKKVTQQPVYSAPVGKYGGGVVGAQTVVEYAVYNNQGSWVGVAKPNFGSWVGYGGDGRIIFRTCRW